MRGHTPRWPNRRRQARLSGECGTTLTLSRLFSPLARMAPMLVPKSYCDPGTLIHHFAQKKNSPLGLALVLYKKERKKERRKMLYKHLRLCNILNESGPHRLILYCWNWLGRTRSYGLVGGGLSLGPGFEVS